MVSTVETREGARIHLQAIASLPGIWEIRALARLESNRMEPRGSFYLIAMGTQVGVLYDRPEEALDWCEAMNRQDAELFVAMNPRTQEGGTKDAVQYVTSCYADLDLPEGVTLANAVEQITAAERPAPSLVLNSG